VNATVDDVPWLVAPAPADTLTEETLAYMHPDGPQALPPEPAA
jgi:hypothetical protein